MRTRAAAIVAALVSLVAPGVASASVSGVVNDPRGDATAGVTPGYLTDIRTVRMNYDADSGSLWGSVDFWDTWSSGNVTGYPWFNFYADVGTSRGGACDTGQPGSVLTHFYTPDDAPIVAVPPDAHIVGGPTLAGAFNLNADYSGWEFSFYDPALVRRGYTCVTNIRVAHNNGSEDAASSFCLGRCAPLPAPVTPTNVRASIDEAGVHLIWDRSADPRFAYFAVRRGTQADTNSGSWTRLTGNFTAPSADDAPAPGTYFYYVTEVNTAGQVSARSNVVRAVVPGPSPGSNAGGGPAPGSGSAGGQPSGGGTAGTGSPSPAGGVLGSYVVHRPTSRRISRPQAQFVTGRVLRRAYGRTFTNGARYRSTCRRNGRAKWTCEVSWRYRGGGYAGRVVVTLARGKGYAATVRVRRR